MEPAVRFGIIGDYNPAAASHLATGQAIADAAAALGIQADIEWLPTQTLAQRATEGLPYDALWCAPGGPYRSLDGALAGIRCARTERIPFIGTCGGFQHVVVEYARNVLGLDDAQHAEYSPSSGRLIVSELACSLRGKTMAIELQEGSRAYAIYQRTPIFEHYFCRFGLNPDYQEMIHSGGLHITGRDHTGGARIVEIVEHPFFIATLFVPQVNSSAATPHPLITAFVASAAAYRGAER